MEFSVLNKQTVQCVMTEAEVADYGMDKKLIYQNDDRVREFFRRIMRRAEQETGFSRERGSIMVHASFLSDESLEITFSTDTSHGTAEDIFDVTNQKTGNKSSGMKNESQTMRQKGISLAVFKSKQLANIMDFCVTAPKDLRSWLYKYNNVYFILADICSYSIHETAVLFNLADEYMDGICYTNGITAFLMEHGTCMIEEHAVGILGQL